MLHFPVIPAKLVPACCKQGAGIQTLSPVSSTGQALRNLSRENREKGTIK